MPQRLASVVVAMILAVALAAPAAATPPGRNGLLIWESSTPDSQPRLQVANPDGTARRTVFKGGPKQGEIEGAFSPADPNLFPDWQRLL